MNDQSAGTLVSDSGANWAHGPAVDAGVGICVDHSPETGRTTVSAIPSGQDIDLNRILEVIADDIRQDGPISAAIAEKFDLKANS